MKLEGIWKISEAPCFGDEGIYWRPVEEMLNDDTVNEEMKGLLFGKYHFSAGGILSILMPLPAGAPPEEVERAVAAGQIQMFDSQTMIVEQHPWKEENGKFYYDSGIQGEVLGEEVSSWMEIEQTENGLELMTFRLVKEE